MPPAPTEHLASFPDLSPLIVQLLYNRQVSSPDAVEAFLDTRLIRSNPFLLKGMDKATTRLRHAIRADEAIAVYGDYDADGVTATALLVSNSARDSMVRCLQLMHSLLPNQMKWMML